MIDISSTQDIKLSNFEEYNFTIDGVICSSMEGFLQSLKLPDIAKQREICDLVGIKAKSKGSKRNKAWKSNQILYWKGKEYKRDGLEYQYLLYRAFNSLYKSNPEYLETLVKTGYQELKHSIGKNDIKDTVLTTQEFLHHLNRIRAIGIEIDFMKKMIDGVIVGETKKFYSETISLTLLHHYLMELGFEENDIEVDWIDYTTTYHHEDKFKNDLYIRGNAFDGWKIMKY